MGLHDASSGACGEICLCERTRVFGRDANPNFAFGSYLLSVRQQTSTSRFALSASPAHAYAPAWH